jgi:hypothetical protein
MHHVAKLDVSKKECVCTPSIERPVNACCNRPGNEVKVNVNTDHRESGRGASESRKYVPIFRLL